LTITLESSNGTAFPSSHLLLQLMYHQQYMSAPPGSPPSTKPHSICLLLMLMLMLTLSIALYVKPLPRCYFVAAVFL
jgi:hypothetical protein